MKPFKLGLVLGRFNHIHHGHKLMITTALATCDKVLLLVGSSQESGTERNPFSLYTRMNLIRKVYEEDIECDLLLLGHIDDLTNENDHSTSWGEFVLQRVDMWRGHYGVKDELDCIVSGVEEDRTKWFDADKVNTVGQILIPKNKVDINATQLRKLIAQNDFNSWSNYVDYEIEEEFDELRDELLQIPYYKGVK